MVEKYYIQKKLISVIYKAKNASAVGRFCRLSHQTVSGNRDVMESVGPENTLPVLRDSLLPALSTEIDSTRKQIFAFFLCTSAGSNRLKGAAVAFPRGRLS